MDKNHRSKVLKIHRKFEEKDGVASEQAILDDDISPEQRMLKMLNEYVKTGENLLSLLKGQRISIPKYFKEDAHLLDIIDIVIHGVPTNIQDKDMLDKDLPNIRYPYSAIGYLDLAFQTIDDWIVDRRHLFVINGEPISYDVLRLIREHITSVRSCMSLDQYFSLQRAFAADLDGVINKAKSKNTGSTSHSTCKHKKCTEPKVSKQNDGEVISLSVDKIIITGAEIKIPVSVLNVLTELIKG